MPILKPKEEQELRKFFSRVVPWPAEGEPGYIDFIPTFKPKDWEKQDAAERKRKNKPKKPGEGDRFPFGDGAFVTNVDAAIMCVGTMFASDRNKDLYFCLSLQSETEKIVRFNREIEIALRDKDHALYLISFFIDVDFKGGEKGYESETEASLAISKFVLDAGLPEPSIMVNTGGGYHIYWTLNKPVTTAEWLPVAWALQAATVKFGLKNDSAVIIDAARVLRVPYTLNYKYDPPRPGKITRFEDKTFDLEEIAKPLEQFKGFVKVNNVTSRMTIVDVFDENFDRKAMPTVPFEDDHLALMHYDELFPPVDMKNVYPQCGFVYKAMKTGGAGLDNTLWMYTTHLAVFTRQGREAAHLMARQHEDYGDGGKTDELYDRKEADRDDGVGPIRCATIAGAGAEACKSCTHRDAGRSPITLDRPLELAPAVSTITLPAPTPFQEVGPPNYMRDPATGYWCAIIDGEQITPADTWIGDAKISFNKDKGYVLSIRYAINKAQMKNPRELDIPFSTIADTPQALSRFLATAGIDFRKPGDLKDMFVAWLDKLKENRHTHTEYEPYGWVTDEDKNVIGFSYNKILYTKDETLPAAAGDAETHKQYTTVGSLDEWKAAARGITSAKRPVLDAILGAQFGGPLIKFAGNSCYLSVYSLDSGAGKSTAMQVGQAVWGNPKTATQGLDDTPLSMFKKLEEIRHLPVNWDEIKTHDAKDRMVAAVFRLTGERGKARLHQDTSQRRVGDWSTILISASNESMVDSIVHATRGNNAGLLRIFELEATKITKSMDRSEFNKIKAAAEKNYGTAGQVYAQWLGMNHEAIEKEVNKTLDEFEHKFKLDSDERFWTTVVTVVYLGAKYANALGLTEIDLPALYKVLTDRIVALREERAAQPNTINSPEFVFGELASYLLKIQRRILNTNRIQVEKKLPAGTIVQLPMDGQRTYDIVDGPLAQIGQDQKLLRLALMEFKKWLTDTGYNPDSIVNKLKEMGATVGYGTLGAGLKGRRVSGVRIIDIPYDGKIDGLMEHLDRITNPTQNVVNFKPTGFNTQ